MTKKYVICTWSGMLRDNWWEKTYRIYETKTSLQSGFLKIFTGRELLKIHKKIKWQEELFRVLISLSNTGTMFISSRTKETLIDAFNNTEKPRNMSLDSKVKWFIRIDSDNKKIGLEWQKTNIIHNGNHWQ